MISPKLSTCVDRIGRSKLFVHMQFQDICESMHNPNMIAR